MVRPMTSTAQAAIAAEVVQRTVAVDLDFDSAPVRLNASPMDISFGGHTYLGVGALGRISAAQESNELRAYDLTMTLSGIPRDAIALALTETYQGRPATVWEVVFDEDGSVIGDPIMLFRGRMDQMNPSIGPGSATVAIRAVNRLADWDQARGSNYTDVEQQRLHPGDRGLSYLASTVELNLIWPARSWWDNNR